MALLKSGRSTAIGMVMGGQLRRTATACMREAAGVRFILVYDTTRQRLCMAEVAGSSRRELARAGEDA